jgi:hypothetical protein
MNGESKSRVNAVEKNPVSIHGWSENFSASTIDGNSIGKIFFP